MYTMHLMHKSELHIWVGQNIAYERQRLGLSQAALAAAFSERLDRTFDQATLARLEKGRRPLDVLELTELAALLGVGREELLATPSEYRWRRRIDTARSEAFAALHKIEINAAKYFEAAQEEKTAIDDLDFQDNRITVESEPERPDPSLPLRICIKALLEASDSDDDSNLDERARELIERLVTQADWAPTRLGPVTAPVVRLPPSRLGFVVLARDSDSEQD